MGDAIYLRGNAGNFVARAQRITSTNASTQFPTSEFKTAKQYRLFKFGPPVVGDNVIFDLNQVQNGDMEDGSPGDEPPKWTVTNGSVLSTEQFFDGAQSASLLSSQTLTQDIELVSGELYFFGAALKNSTGSTGGSTHQLFIHAQDLRTGKWLGGGASWGNSSGAFLGQTSTGWNNGSILNVTAEDATWGTTLVRVYLTKSGPGTSYVDNVNVYGRSDLISFHAHNINTNQGVQISGNDNDFSTSTGTLLVTIESTGTYEIHRERFYAKYTEIANRYVRVRFTRKNSDPIKIGQVGIGNFSTLLRTPDLQSPIVRDQPQTRIESGAGHIASINKTEHPNITFSPNFGMLTSQVEQVVEEVGLASKNGEEPIVFIPDDSTNKSTGVYLVHVNSGVNYARRSVDRYDFSLTLTEQIFPFDSK